MKRIIGILGLILVVTTASFAQKNAATKERMQAMRTAFITEKLQLTPDEAQDFWPLYNEYQNKRKALRKGHKKGANIDVMSDKEVDNYMANTLEKEQQGLDLKKEYFQKLQSVISTRKIAKLVQAEKEFKKRLVKRTQKQKQQTKGARNN